LDLNNWGHLKEKKEGRSSEKRRDHEGRDQRVGREESLEKETTPRIRRFNRRTRLPENAFKGRKTAKPVAAKVDQATHLKE